MTRHSQRNIRSAHPFRSCRGFTLIEMIVSAGVTVLLSAIMLGIVSNVVGISNRATGSIQENTQASMAIDVLTHDLQSAIMMATNDVWLAATVQPDQAGFGDPGGGSLGFWDPLGGGEIKPGWSDPGTEDSSRNLAPESRDLEDYRFGMAGMWLRFITNVTDENISGLEDFSSPRAVAYQIVRHRIDDDDEDSSIRYGLFRTEVRSYSETKSSTFSAGYDLFSPDYCDRENGEYANGYPGRIRRPARPFLLAINVIDFGIRVYERDSSGDLVLVYPLLDTDLCYAATRDTAAIQPLESTDGLVDYSSNTVYGFPEVIEVSLRVISENGAKLLETLETGSTLGSDWWTIAQAHSRVFSRRVVLKAQPLRR